LKLKICVTSKGYIYEDRILSCYLTGNLKQGLDVCLRVGNPKYGICQAVGIPGWRDLGESMCFICGWDAAGCPKTLVIFQYLLAEGAVSSACLLGHAPPISGVSMKQSFDLKGKKIKKRKNVEKPV